MDFFSQLSYVADRNQVYSSSFYASFPPLAFLFYWCIRQLIPASALAGLTGRAIRENVYSLVVYLGYTAVLIVLSVFLFQTFLDRKRRDVQLVTCLMLFVSAPFISLYERGNAAFLVLIFLLGFLLLRDSEMPWKRESALILLAAAAGFKLYPAIFGLLYLKERRFPEAARLTLYGCLALLLPFFFFGGLRDIPLFLGNLRAISYDIIQYGDLRSIVYLTILIGEHLGFGREPLLFWGKLFSLVFLALGCLAVLCEDRLWRQVLILTGIMILYPVWSGSYTIIYMALPLLLFLGQDSFDPGDGFFAAVFGLIFTFILWEPSWAQELFHSNLSYALRAGGVILLTGAGIIQAFARGSQKRR